MRILSRRRLCPLLDTPLFGVANKETAELLIAHGANPKAKSELGGLTPIVMLAARGAEADEIVELLIAKNAEPKTKTKDGFYSTPSCSHVWIYKNG